jgi:hypothetical protein
MYVNAIEDFAGHFGTVALAQKGMGLASRQWSLSVSKPHRYFVIALMPPSIRGGRAWTLETPSQDYAESFLADCIVGYSPEHARTIVASVRAGEKSFNEQVRMNPKFEAQVRAELSRLRSSRRMRD